MEYIFLIFCAAVSFLPDAVDLDRFIEVNSCTLSLRKTSIKGFKNASCSFKTLSNFSVLLETGLKNNYITNSELNTILKWRESPSNWKINA